MWYGADATTLTAKQASPMAAAQPTTSMMRAEDAQAISTLITTPNHPFHTTARKWVTAGELHIGDTILRANGEYGTVTATTYAYQPQSMYNLTVDTAHTYFIGDGEWLVHNAKCDVTQALKSFKRKDFFAGSQQYSITKERMHHILTRHHPNYWDGSVKTTQTFLDESLSVNDVSDIVKETIQNGFDSRTGGNGRFTYEAVINGTGYRARTEYGKIVQFYPLP